MIMQTLRQFSTCVNASSSPVHHKHTEIGQQGVISRLLPSFSTDSFLRDTIRGVAHSVTRRIKQDKCREKQATMNLAWCTKGDTFSMKRFLFTILFALCLLAGISLPSFAQADGTFPEPEADIASTTGGSILIFPYYGSTLSGNGSVLTDTTLNITGSNYGSFKIKIYLVAEGYAPIILYRCFASSEGTVRLKMSEIDPTYTGSAYVFLVNDQGVPVKQNVLRGVAQIKRNNRV